MTAGWGNQIGGYVLHLPSGQGPAVRPRDVRLGAVLDGDLDTFMQAELGRLATGRPPSADGDADD